MATTLKALQSARSYLNDNNAKMWTDDTLLPHLKEAYRDLLLVLWLNGLPVIREKSSVISVAALATSLTLPTDLIQPISLKERAVGGGNDWIPMVETDFEPDSSMEVTLNSWVWREETILFVGATTAREVLMKYLKSLSIPEGANSALGFMFAEIFLGPQTAGYAAGSVGNITLAAELLYVNGQQVGIAGSKLDIILRANVKGQQNLPVRRIPYRRFSRTRYSL